ncbi:MAG: tetratricopeptide repeat protein [Lentisphaerae bacterium]|jgi:tetratricopeptide (TPR) repeat protein|nr:tetratricopeptide repeat protein [Lentisphaerota bacterium]MBT4821867.1 tetratricopeptide repeat protein [Lentisphaerota bacterium]MBT5610189.1 tetratricopeptide repeat protein [Lentisphaerota bacterium]MBT7057078.1 tetratricopeptide repeat protein [Lentisphaerota bacterium]MBT7846199.1 tetratricopeptide repeat protein [Lentisphaerota bacterium]
MMTKDTISGLRLVLAFSVLAARAVGVDYAATVAEAQKRGDLGTVNRLCNEWAAAAPGDERPRIALGRALTRAGMVDRALEQFELACEANPLSAAPRCELGMLFLEEGLPDEAIKEFAQASRLQASFLPAMLGMVKALLAKGDVARALDAAQQAVASASKDAGAHSALGECYWTAGKGAEAESSFAKALSLDADDLDALFGQARALQLKGQEAKAEELWQRFMEREPAGTRASMVRNGWVILSLDQLPKGCRKCPVWSPDGRHIMYGYERLGVIDLRTRAHRGLKVTGGRKLFFHDWSPDGRSVVAQIRMPEGRPNPCLFDLRLSEGALDGDKFEPLGEAAFGRFSPDGTGILMSAGASVRGGHRASYGLGVIQLSDRGLQSIPWKNAQRPGRNQANWTPDGLRVVFHAHGPGAPKDRQLYVSTLDGEEPPLRLTDNSVMNVGPCVSVDGVSVAYAAALGGGGTAIHLVRIDGTGGVPHLASGDRPAWSPDGRRLAYDTPRGIAVVCFGGLGVSPVTVHAEAKAGALFVVAANPTEMDQQISFRWEAFGDDSVRIGPGGESENTAVLKAGERVEWPVDVPTGGDVAVSTVKIAVRNQNGVGAVELVDWAALSQ